MGICMSQHSEAKKYSRFVSHYKELTKIIMIMIKAKIIILSIIKQSFSRDYLFF